MNGDAKKIEKTDLILLLLFAKGPNGKEAEPIRGITKVMKLLFLLEQEGGVKDGFEFKPYKMGPFSSEVYPELEFLQTFPKVDNPLLVKSTPTGKIVPPKKYFFSFSSSDESEHEKLTRELADPSVNPEQLKAVDDLGGGNDLNSPALTGEEINVDFSLSELGIKFASHLAKKEPELLSKIEKIKRKYTGLSLRDLLRYVYLTYPETTTESEIIPQVL